MKRRDFLKTSGALGIATVVTPGGIFQTNHRFQQASELESNFMTPPASAKPHTWWHWMNGNVTKEGITLDLEAMARVGIGGFQNFDAGTGIPKGPIVYLSPEWMELKKHAIAEANRLDLEFTMHNCPGWSSSGGPWITPELSMLEVTWSELHLEGGKKIDAFLQHPLTRLNFYKDICVLAFPALANDKQQKDWEMRANYNFNRYGIEDIKDDAPAINEKDIVDVTRFLKPTGQFEWNAPKGNWTIIRFGYTPIGTQNRSAPDTGVGLECDKYSATAFEFHFNKMMTNLLPFLEPLGKKAKVGLLIDSYEVGMQNWTPGFEQIFQNKTGYALHNYLPAITGRVVNSADHTNRFLWDFRRVQGDLMADNYYGKFTELCHKNNIISYIQPYDRGPMEELQIGSRVDINVGEFWNNLSWLFQNNRTMRRTVKLSAAIAHTNGQKIVAAESFTGEPSSSKWQEHPFALKVLGDRMFTQGLNRMVFHRFAHQPHPTAKPGMTMGPWGSHFDRTNTWWEQGKEWMTYLSRCQYMLQQGLFCAEVAFFTGEDAGVYTKIEKGEVGWKVPNGCDYDVINAETLLKAGVKNGRLTLADGMSYRILILMPALQSKMSVKVLSKLKELAEQKLIIIGERPLRTPGLTNDEAQFKGLVDELWPGKIIAFESSDDISLESVLQENGWIPDFEFTSHSAEAPINYIHRKTTDGADIYFIANERRTTEDLVCNFAVVDRTPEFWDPVTGKTQKVRVYKNGKDRITVPITLNPFGSLFVVFRSPADKNPVVSITKNDAPLLPTTPYNTKQKTYPDLFDNFVIELLAKPENEVMLNTNNFMEGQRPWTDFYAIYPTPGEEVYGYGHSTFGLTIGRNGVAVWENTGGKPEFNFSVEKAISGWAKIELRCKEKVPSIYINDEHVGDGIRSEHIVHPPGGSYNWGDEASYYNGDMRDVTIGPLGGEQKRDKKKWSDILIDDAGRVIAFWDGKCTVARHDGTSKTVKVSGGLSFYGGVDWTVTFPPGSGAPASIKLPELISLHQHPTPGVRYFSGTCLYNLTFPFKRMTEDRKAEVRYFMDLGEVEVIAEVILNGKNLGTLWTRPFLIDITDSLIMGENKLVVNVTNLWPNRLIGDEQEPEQYRYLDGPRRGFAVLGTGAIQELPEWYKNGKPKPNDGRVAFTTWRHYTKDSPLLQSGLIGPVVIHEGAVVKLS